MLDKKKIIIRAAPSPTGALHIGTARTILFNYLFSRQNKGKFIIRIEDTDKERSELKWEKDILDGIHRLGMEYDEFYRQSERTEIYKKYLEGILKSGKAFWCFHSKSELEDEKREQIEKKETPRHVCGRKNSKSASADEKGVIRLAVSAEIIKFNDLVRGEISFDSDLLGDISIAKDDNSPLYNFAVVIDDYEMGVSHVIRGEDHISNTPKQILIQEALGFPRPEYAHLPLILGPDKSKLSKRHGAVSVAEYLDQGYLPEAIVNFIAMLGWSPGDDREIFSMEELIREFSLNNIQKSGAVFNIDKLDWINGHYIRKMPAAELVDLCLPFLKANIESGRGEFSKDYVEKVVALEQPRLKKLSEIGEKTDYFFKKPVFGKDLLKWKNMSDEEILKSLALSEKIVNSFEKRFTKEKIEEIFLKEAEKLGDRGELLWPLRSSLSGKKFSPGPFEIAAVLGKEEVSARLSEAVKILKS